MGRSQAGRMVLVGLALLSATVSCERLPDAGNQLPFGAVDRPRSGDTVREAVDVGGWAMDDSKVESVRVYVDGKFVAVTHVDFDRPDVSILNSFHAHGSDRHGWNVKVPLGNLLGMHTIVAQAVDDDGATRDLGTMVVNVTRNE